jgi:hypothetical protein
VMCRHLVPLAAFLVQPHQASNVGNVSP